MKKLLYNLIFNVERTLFHFVFLCFFLIGIGELTVYGQDTKVHSPGALLDSVFDRFGGRYVMDDIKIRQGTYAGANARMDETCPGSYFHLFYEDGSGMEIPNDPIHMAKRAVMCQVFLDISNFISRSVPPANYPTVPINIWVQNPTGVNPAVGNGARASAFYTCPLLPAGIIDGEVWKCINTGTDSYIGTFPPVVPLTSMGVNGMGFYHGVMAVALTPDGTNPNSNWYTDLTQVNPITNNEVDLYSVVLHEATHMLGFNSLITETGAPEFLNYYSRYDLFLQTQGTSSVPVISPFGNLACGMYDYGFNLTSADLAPNPTATCNPNTMINATVCADAIAYGGSANQLTYTPYCFEQGSSLSHFEDMCVNQGGNIVNMGNDEFWVMSNSINPGGLSLKRFYQPEERQVLCDLGYTVDTVFGTNQQIVQHSYGGIGCGDQVAGLNDGIIMAPPANTYAYVSNMGAPVQINGPGLPCLLDNDIGATDFICLEPVIGGGTVTSTAGNNATAISYTPTPGFTGVALLRYIPIRTATGQLGNITYVYVMVTGDCNCTPCEVVGNGGFENSQGCGQLNSPTIDVDCWQVWEQTSDLFTSLPCNPAFTIPTTFSNPPANIYNFGVPPFLCNGNNVPIVNEHFLGLRGKWDVNAPFWESVQSPLCTPLAPNTAYTIRFQARMADGNISGFPGVPMGDATIRIAFYDNTIPFLPPFNTNASPMFMDFIVPFNPAPQPNGWVTYTATFTTPATPALNWIAIANTDVDFLANPGSNPATPYQNYVYIDDVVIDVFDFDLPDFICQGDMFEDLLDFVNPGPLPPGSFNFTGAGVLTNVVNGQNVFVFDPGLVGLGITSINLCYVEGNGCTHTFTEFIEVFDCCAGATPDFVLTGTISAQNLLAVDATTFINHTLYIDGILNIDTDVYPQGCTFIMEADSRIIVESGRVFGVDNCVFRGCDFLWEGIRVESGGKITLTNTEIRDAMTGVVPEDNSIVTIQKCVFRDNFIGLYVVPDAPLPLATSKPVFFGPFYGNTFEGTGSLLPFSPTTTLTLPPNTAVNLGTQPYCGIYCNRWVMNIGISGFAFNLFHKMNCGIRSVSSQLTVVNSIFKLIHRNNAYTNNAATGDGAGIWATGTPDTYVSLLSQIGYGHSPSSTLSYDDCEEGIWTNNVKVFAAKNHQKRIRRVGFELSGTQTSADILQNRIESDWGGDSGYWD